MVGSSPSCSLDSSSASVSSLLHQCTASSSKPSGADASLIYAPIALTVGSLALLRMIPLNNSFRITPQDECLTEVAGSLDPCRKCNEAGVCFERGLVFAFANLRAEQLFMLLLPRHLRIS